MISERKIRILQFGEGNFLRGFMEDMVQHACDNSDYDGSVAVIKPRTGGSLDRFKAQGNRYCLVLRGIRDGRTINEIRQIDSIGAVYYGDTDKDKYLSLAGTADIRLVVSNTTEAGIVFDPDDKDPEGPLMSYPGKLTAFLYKRFCAFENGSAADRGGLVILPMELNENNGELLLRCVLKYAGYWNLPHEFSDWIVNDNLFCNTLVDRIVSGFPKTEAGQLQAEAGFRDELMVVAEPYGSLVIETDSPDRVINAFPFDRCGVKVTFTEDLTPYRQQKVKLLNGIHTAICMTGLMMGLKYVDECMSKPLLRRYVNEAVAEEIIPTIKLPKEETEAFAKAVIERFENPYLHHSLEDISLNSVSKWETRILPTVRDFFAIYGEYPDRMLFSLAVMIVFYEGGWKKCGMKKLRDDADPLRIIHGNRDLEELVYHLVSEIKDEGVQEALRRLVKTDA